MRNESDFIKSSELQGHLPAPPPPPAHHRVTSPFFRSGGSRPDFLLALLSLSPSLSAALLRSQSRSREKKISSMLAAESSPSGAQEPGGRAEGAVLPCPPHPGPRGAHSRPPRRGGAPRGPSLTAQQPGPQTSRLAASAGNFP